jgi:hypothetical protein
MFAVKGIYDGNKIIMENPAPVKQKCEVTIIFPVDAEQLIPAEDL